MRRFLICLLVSACAASASAQIPTPLTGGKLGRPHDELMAQQKLLVADYCRMDFTGGRLTPNGWQQMRQFTTMRANPDFKTVFIISRYQVIESADSPTVRVNYVVIGRYEEGVGYTAMSGIKAVTFKTREVDRELRIKGMDSSSPFVSRKAAIEWLQRKLPAASETPQKNIILAAIKALDTTPAAAPASPKPAQ